MFNIPSSITQGDRISWVESNNYNPATDTMSCFIRGAGTPLDLTAIANGTDFQFEITSSQSNGLEPGSYKVQFVVFSGSNKTTLGIANLLVCPSFENLTEVETRTRDEIELEQINKAISLLNEGVAEYYIGERRVRYHEIDKLYERQRYLQTLINRAKQKNNKAGRNVPIRFSW